MQSTKKKTGDGSSRSGTEQGPMMGAEGAGGRGLTSIVETVLVRGRRVEQREGPLSSRNLGEAEKEPTL